MRDMLKVAKCLEGLNCSTICKSGRRIKNALPDKKRLVPTTCKLLRTLLDGRPVGCCYSRARLPHILSVKVSAASSVTSHIQVQQTHAAARPLHTSSCGNIKLFSIHAGGSSLADRAAEPAARVLRKRPARSRAPPLLL